MKPLRATTVERSVPPFMKTVSSFRFVSLFAGLLALTTLVFSPGCVAVAAGAGAGAGVVAYVRGELDVTLDHPFDTVTRATDKAVQQLRFSKVSEGRDALLTLITVRNAAEKKIVIRLDSTGRDLTRVRIRVGIFGNKALSMTILEKIRANL